MAFGTDCCNSCPTPQTVNVPGAPGATGPQGPQGDPATMLPAQTFYVIGSSQALTVTNTQLLAATVTLPADGSYLIFAGVRIDYNNATTMSSRTVYLRLYRTNNGPATIANTEHELATGIVTADSSTLCSTTLPAVVYAGTATDIIHLQGSISSVLTDPYESGTIIAVEAWILALPIQ